MFVLGIDPGLARTGYAVVEDQPKAPRVICAGTIHTEASAPIAERLGELFDDITRLIAEYGPSEAALEQVFVNRNLQTATAVGRASGVALLAAGRAGLEVYEYTPSAVKAAVAGVGNAPKEQIRRTLAKRMGTAELAAPDAVDAIAVALCHLQYSPLRRAVEGAS